MQQRAGLEKKRKDSTFIKTLARPQGKKHTEQTNHQYQEQNKR